MDRLDDQNRTVAILDIGGVHLGTDQQTASIGHNMSLAPFDLLGGIVTLRSTALGRLDRLAVDDPGRRAGFAPSDFPGLQQKLINALEETGISPFIKMPLHCRPNGLRAGIKGSINVYSASLR